MQLRGVAGSGPARGSDDFQRHLVWVAVLRRVSRGVDGNAQLQPSVRNLVLQRQSHELSLAMPEDACPFGGAGRADRTPAVFDVAEVLTRDAELAGKLSCGRESINLAPEFFLGQGHLRVFLEFSAPPGDLRLLGLCQRRQDAAEKCFPQLHPVFRWKLQGSLC